MLGSQRTDNMSGTFLGGEEISFLENRGERERGRLGYYTFFPLTDEDVAFWVLGLVFETGEPIFVNISLKGRAQIQGSQTFLVHGVLSILVMFS